MKRKKTQARSDFDIKGMQPSIQNQIQPLVPIKASNREEISISIKKIYIVALRIYSASSQNICTKIDHFPATNDAGNKGQLENSKMLLP